MRKKLSIILLTMTATLSATAQALQGDSIGNDTLSVTTQMSQTDHLLKYPVRALGEVTILNGIIHGLNRYVLNEAYAQTTLKSIRRNFHKGYIWDNDNYYTNEMGHPYQGNLYFNAARSNGLNFWQSAPYALVGSVMWEYLGETEQPSINDIVTTTIAGSFMGEVTHRIARYFIDERERGASRFVREAAAALFNPVEGFHRLVSGRMWKVRPSTPSTHSANDDFFRLSVGDRYIANADNMGNGQHQTFLNFAMECGDTPDDEPHFTPYDYFAVDGTFAIGKGQHMVSDLSMTGRICSTPLYTGQNTKSELGLYQYFYYNDIHLPDDSRGVFPFGEAISFGPALTLAFPRLAPHITFRQHLYARGIGLGTAESDYYDVHERQYNMGSGYGVSSQSRLTWENQSSIQFDAYYMHLYTWKGYEPHDMKEPDLSVLGDRSDACLLRLSMQLRTRLYQQWSLALGASFFHRHTHYKYHSTHRTDSYELRAGLEWQL